MELAERAEMEGASPQLPEDIKEKRKAFRHIKEHVRGASADRREHRRRSEARGGGAGPSEQDHEAIDMEEIDLNKK